MPEFISVDVEDGVATLLLQRPPMNALSLQMQREIKQAADELGSRSDVGAVVLYGGPKVFAAGADIKEMSGMTYQDMLRASSGLQDAFTAVARIPQPTIAAVTGYALGGGCELAMACHLRVASSNAVFGQPEVKLGLIPGYAGTQRLPRLVGRGRALEILITGRNVGAEEAASIGLVNSVCEPGKLVDSVDALLEKILANGPLAVGHCIEAVNHGLDLPFDDACLLEATLFGVGAASEEMREGTSAFLEKRKAQFRS